MVSSTPWLHFTPGKDPVPILQEAGWAPGPVWTGRKSHPHRDSIPDRPARSQSLYRLSYPAQHDTVLQLHLYPYSSLKLCGDSTVSNEFTDKGGKICSTCCVLMFTARQSFHCLSPENTINANKRHLFFNLTITDKMVTVTSVIFSWIAAAIKNTLHGRRIK